MENTTLEVITEPVDLTVTPQANPAAAFDELKAKALTLQETADKLAISEGDQRLNSKLARTTRLEWRQIRIAIEHKRKELGEDLLRATQKINKEAKELREFCEGYEEKLLAIEESAERQEAARKAAIKQAREEKLAEFGINTAAYPLAEMREEDFENLLNFQTSERDRKAAEAKRIEEERLAQEKADREERARLRLENERLQREKEEAEAAAKVERERVEAERKAEAENARKEREALEAAAKAEREAAEKKAAAEREESRKALTAVEEKAKAERLASEAIARKEREARQKLEQEAAARLEEEKANQAATAKARKQAEAAPDKEKLTAYAAEVSKVPMPSMATQEGKDLAAKFATKSADFKAWMQRQIDAI